MARANTATLDGLLVGYGARDTYNMESARVHTLGRLHQIEIVLNAANSGDASTGSLSAKEAVIPAGSMLLSADFVVATTLVGPTAATGIDVGLKDTVDGTAIDADGLVATVALSGVSVGAGALINTITSQDAVVSIDVDAAVTAGEATVLVQYVEPAAGQDAPDVITGEI